MKILARVKACATTANIGPGYDSAGIALDLYNEYIFYENSKYAVEVEGYDCGNIPTDESNLIFIALKNLIKKFSGNTEIPLKVVNKINIPVGKGLGSSASAVAAGLLAANKIYDLGLKISDLLCAGVEIEPHPDNLAPCLAGGLIICYENGCCSYEKIKLDSDLKVMILVPQSYVNTNEARKLIPKNVPISDAIFNLSHFALLVKSLADSDLEKASYYIRDKLHQPYRKNVYPKSMEIVDKFNLSFKVPSAISGSGPSVFSIMDRQKYERDFNNIKNFLSESYPDFKIILTNVNNEGSKVI